MTTTRSATDVLPAGGFLGRAAAAGVDGAVGVGSGPLRVDLTRHSATLDG